MRGFGGIVSCDSNERHTPDVANPAEDLIAHSAKKREAQSNIPPKNSLTPSADDFHASATQNGDGYPPSWSPSSLKLRRDKAIGVMRQRNKRAGGTPGRKQPPCNKKSVCI